MISGNTHVVAIVADPVAHVRTPQAFNAFVQAQGIDAVMVPFHVKPDGFEAFMAAVAHIDNLRGLIITIPYKETVVASCSSLTESAKRIGAVNIVRFGKEAETGNRVITGHNLDGEGFVGGLVREGYRFAGKRVYMAGAGGAAKAIAHSLADHGVASLGIYNRNTERAAQLIQQLRTYYPHIDFHVADDCPKDYALALNATSLGLGEQDSLPFRLSALPVTTLVAEVVMKVNMTPLLVQAQQRAMPIHFGHHMVDVQIERMAEFLGLY